MSHSIPLLIDRCVRSSIAPNLPRTVCGRIFYSFSRFASSNVAGTDLASAPSGSRSRAHSQAQSTAVLCVDYLPDSATEDGIAKAFAPLAKVRNVQFERRRIGSFLGRAYVSFDSPEDFQRVLSSQTPLQYRGETLHVEPWTLPTLSTSVLRVCNLPSRVVAKQEVIDVFSSHAAVQDVWFTPEVRWCHVDFVSEGAAKSALAGAYETPPTLDGQKLDVEIALDPPHRILHLLGINGGEKQLQELLEPYEGSVQAIRLGTYGTAVGLVEFDTVESAIRAKHDLLRRGVLTKFSKYQQLKPDVWIPPTYAEDSPNVPNVVLVSNVPSSEKASSISARFHLKTGAPFVIQVKDKEGVFTGRALMIFSTPEEAAYVQRRHQSTPFTFRGVPLVLTRSRVPRVSQPRSPTSTIMVHGARPESNFKIHLWPTMGRFGRIDRIDWTSPTSYAIKFRDVESAVRAIEAHCLKPFSIGGRQLKLHFTHGPEDTRPEGKA